MTACARWWPTTRDGYVFAWNVPGSNAGVVEWSSFHHDPAGTGNYETELDFDAPPPPPDDKVMGGGCCTCRIGAEHETDTSQAAGPFLVLALFGLWVARRRTAPAAASAPHSRIPPRKLVAPRRGC